MQVPSSSYLKLALLGFCKKIILNQMVKRVGCRSAISALLCVTPDGQILGRWVFAVDVTSGGITKTKGQLLGRWVFSVGVTRGGPL